MNGDNQQEIERKYDVDESAAVPALTAVPGIARAESAGVHILEAVYFDTADGSLGRRRIAVRRRRGGHDAGWHIKRSTAEGRFEQQWPLGTDDDVPAEVQALLEEACGGPVELSPLAELTTTRAITLLQDAAGTPVIELADDRVTALDVRAEVERSWREWEAELLPGAPADADEPGGLLDAVETALCAAGAVVSASPAKIARALGLN